MTRSEVTRWLLSLSTEEFEALGHLLSGSYASRSSGGRSMRDALSEDAAGRDVDASAHGASS